MTPILVIAATPWFDVMQASAAAQAGSDASKLAFSKWLDEVVGRGARASERETALANGHNLRVTAAQEEALRLLTSTDAPVLCDSRICWTLGALTRVLPDAPLLLVIEPPVLAIARRISSGACTDPRTDARIWRAGARALWSAAQQAGERALLVDSGDLQHHTDAVAVAARRHAGVAWTPVSAQFDVDPLAQAIAQVAVNADPDTQETWEELAAATVPVTPADVPASAGPTWAAHADIEAAARRHQALLSSEATLPVLREQLNSATLRGETLLKELDDARAHASTLDAERALAGSQLATLKTTLDSTRAEFDAFCTERDAQVAELRSTLDTAHANLAQLHTERDAQVAELRSTLDTAHANLAQLHTERDAQVAELRSTLDTAHANLAQLHTERDAQVAELRSTLDTAHANLAQLHTERDAQVAELRSTLDTAHANLAQLHTERDAQVAELRQDLSSHRQSIRRLREKLAADIALKLSIQRESDRRLLRLHQVQAELEHYFEAHQMLARGDGARRTALERIEIGAINFDGAQLTQPYRHIDVTLVEVSYGARRHHSINARIVQHHGRSGLLLFAPASGPTPLSAWLPTGEENGRPFLLLIPSDPASIATLSALGTSDWGFVVDLVEQLARACADERAAIRDVWHPLALRLLGELRHMPPRLRYDGVVPLPALAANGQELSARFEQVLAGDRPATGLVLRWRPGARAGEVALSLQALPADDHRQRVVDAWPLDDDGRWAAVMPLPLGPALDPVQVRHAWDGLTDADRTGIVSLLDALPAAIRAHRDDELPPGWPRARLELAAVKLASMARRARTGAKWRHWLRAAKRRMQR